MGLGAWVINGIYKAHLGCREVGCTGFEIKQMKQDGLWYWNWKTEGAVAEALSWGADKVVGQKSIEEPGVIEKLADSKNPLRAPSQPGCNANAIVRT